MKNKFYIYLLILFLIVPSVMLSSQIEDSPKINAEIKSDTLIEMQKTTSSKIQVEITIPNEHHIYLKSEYAIVINFKFANDSLFKIINVEKPEGEEYRDDIVLVDKGIFSLEITSSDEVEIEETYEEKLIIKYGICNSKSGICFPPADFNLDIKLKIIE